MCAVVSRRLLQGLKYHYGSPGSLSDAKRTSCEGTAVHIYERESNQQQHRRSFTPDSDLQILCFIAYFPPDPKDFCFSLIKEMAFFIQHCIQC
jgi:hypothetical protein